MCACVVGTVRGDRQLLPPLFFLAPQGKNNSGSLKSDGNPTCGYADDVPDLADLRRERHNGRRARPEAALAFVVSPPREHAAGSRDGRGMGVARGYEKHVRRKAGHGRWEEGFLARGAEAELAPVVQSAAEDGAGGEEHERVAAAAGD